MAGSDEASIINEMIAYGGSSRGRGVLGNQGILVEINLCDGQLYRFSLYGESFKGRDSELAELKISLSTLILMDINRGTLSLQEAQTLGLITLEGEIGLARLFQKATRWGLIREVSRTHFS